MKALYYSVGCMLWLAACSSPAAHFLGYNDKAIQSYAIGQVHVRASFSNQGFRVVKKG